MFSADFVNCWEVINLLFEIDFSKKDFISKSFDGHLHVHLAITYVGSRAVSD